MKARMFLGFLVAIVCFFTDVVVGFNDYLMVALALFIAYITQSVIIEFQMGSRYLIADHFNKESEISQVLKKPGIIAFVFSSIVAFILALSFLAFAKGLMIKHSFVALTTILFICSVMLYGFFSTLEKDKENSRIADEDKSNLLSSTVSKHVVYNTSYFANFAFKVVVVAVLLNFVFALAFSAFDTAYFISANVNLANFDEYTVNQAIAYSEHNTFSRALINAYLLMDNFKLALVNQLLDVFYTTEDKLGSFYVFYFLTLLLNVIKLIPFSIGFVFLLKGVRIRSSKYQYYAGVAKEKVVSSADKILKRYQQRTSSKGDS